MVVTVRVWSVKLATKVQAPAGCLGVAGDSVDGWQLAALDLGDPARRDAHGLGELGLGEATLLALAGEPLAALPGHQGRARRSASSGSPARSM